MSNLYEDRSPPLPQGNPGPGKNKVKLPAIFLIVVAGLGLTMSIVNLGLAIFREPPVDPSATDFQTEFNKSAYGFPAIVMQSIFIVLNALIAVAGVQMLRLKSYSFAVAGSILAMVNFGSLCCILGLPLGIWSLITLTQEDVKQQFKQAP